jgi:hypothetical protein
MSVDVTQAKQRIDTIMDGYQQAVGMQPHSVFASTATRVSASVAGKVYEAWVLCEVLERLRVDEAYAATLRGASTVTLKSSPGPINPGYSYFELYDGTTRLELWTDVEFLTYSHDARSPASPAAGEYHELDIVIVPAGTTDRPRHDEVVIGVECKHTTYRKELLRAVLGVRRELSLLVPPQPTPFFVWPRRDVPASPPSCLLAYCSSASIQQYDEPGATFGIDFIHEPLP